MWGRAKEEDEEKKRRPGDAEAPRVPRQAPAIPPQDEADRKLKHPQASGTTQTPPPNNSNTTSHPNMERPSVPRAQQEESGDAALKRAERERRSSYTNPPNKTASPPANATNTTRRSSRTRPNRDDKKAGHQDIQNDIQEARAKARNHRRGSTTDSAGGDSEASSGVATRLTSAAAREKGVTGDDDTPMAVGAYQVSRRAPGQMPQWARPQIMSPSHPEDEQSLSTADQASSVASPSSLGDTVSSLGGTSNLHQSASSVGSSTFEDEPSRNRNRNRRMNGQQRQNAYVDAYSTNLILPKTVMEEPEDKNAKKIFFLKMKLICSLVAVIILLSLSVLILTGNIEITADPSMHPHTNQSGTTGYTMKLDHCDTNGTFILDSPEDLARSVRYLELSFLMELEWVQDEAAVFKGALCGPHDLALTWLADVDPMELSIVSLQDNNRNIRQRLALAILYFSTDMTSTFLNQFWMTPISECLWEGVECDTDGFVTQMQLSNFHLAGPIPELLFPLLPSLETLDLSKNKLTGTIPLSIYSSSSLVTLHLESNEISGIMDKTKWTAQNLENIYLGNNALSGALPTTLMSLPKLKNLDICDNYLTGTIPTAMALLSNLNVLNFKSNKLTGTVSDAIFNLPNLKNISLASNMLRGHLPKVMSSTLENIDCSENKLTGTLPEVLYSLTNLDFLDLHRNTLTGSLSSRVTNLVKLAEFDLNYNQLGHSLPTELSTLSSLRIIVLGHNLLTGTLFSGIEQMANLEWLELGDNYLAGPLPRGMGDLKSLKTLNLANNGFIGIIPESMGKLSHLLFMQLNKNSLVGSVPESLCGGGVHHQFYVDPTIHCACCYE